MEVPLAVMSPKRVLELMLDIKEPDGDRGAHDHHGSLHEKEGADSHKPDKQRDDAGDCCVCPHCAYPGLPARAHHAERKAIMQHEEVSRNQSKHDERVTVGSIDEALKAGLRQIFIGRQRDDVAAAAIIEIAGVGVVQRMRAQPKTVGRQSDDADDAADPIIRRASPEAGPVAAVVLNHKKAHKKAGGRQSQQETKPIADPERRPHQHP